MADAATRFRIEAIVRGLENVEALKNSVKRLQSTATPAAADVNKLKQAAEALGRATDRTENDLRTAIAVLKDLRANVALNDAEFRRLTATIGKYEQQLNKANGTAGQFSKAGQTIGAVAASGVFGGPEGLLGAGIGAFFGPGGALAGGAIGAQVGQIRQAIGDTATYAAEVSKLNIALREIAGSQREYLASQQAINRVVSDFNVPVLDATKGFTRLTASVVGAGGNVGDAERVFRGVSAAIKASGGSAEDVQASILAMSQVFGKGKVSAEELQGQLGERLPGAVTLFAQATGRTLPQLAKDLEQGTVGLNDLMKFVEALAVKYDAAAKRMADSQDESGARMQVALDNLKLKIGETFKPIGSELQDSIASAAEVVSAQIDKTGKALAGAQKLLEPLVTEFSKLKTALDNLQGILPAFFTDLSNRISLFMPVLTPFIVSLKAAIALRDQLAGGANAQDSGMYGRYASGASQQSYTTKPTVFANPSGKGDLDTKALERAERERIRNAIELNRLEQERVRAYFDQQKAGKDRLTQLAIERDELYYITRLKLQAVGLEKKSAILTQAGIDAVAAQGVAQLANIAAQRQEIVKAIDDIATKSNEITKKVFSGFAEKTPFEQAYDRINDQIAQAIQQQDDLLKKLADAGGNNPETAQARAAIRVNRGSLTGITPEQKSRMASSLIGDDALKSLKAQVFELQNSGRELTTLEQLKQKYLSDWDKLDPQLRAQLETMANQVDMLEKQIEQATKLKDAVVNPLRDGLTQTFDLLINGTQNWGNSLREIASSVLKDIAKQLLQIYVINQLISGISKLFPSPGGGTIPVAAVAANGMVAANGIQPFAKGGIVNSPTLFKFASGGTLRNGLMGEAGPEAIIPLRRGADGKLGVAGGGSTTVNVSVDAKGTSVQGDNNRGEALGRAVSQAVQAELIKQRRPGGLLAA